jgi:hypothetical protein
VSDLSDLVESLKRTVAVPGAFAASFPSTTDDDMAAVLADGMVEAQLDGWLQLMSLDLESNLTVPDISVPQGALIVLYASVRILMSEIRNIKSRVVYESGGARFEQEQGASVLTEQLKILTDRKKYLVELARLHGYVTTFAMFDGYFARTVNENINVDRVLLNGFSLQLGITDRF